MVTTNESKPTIPEGYEQLKPGTLKEPDDLFWSRRRLEWTRTKSPGSRVSDRLIVVRPVAGFRDMPQTKTAGEATW